MWFTILDRGESPSYSLHQRVWSIFPDLQKQGAERAFCYRDNGSEVYVLSSAMPSAESRRVEINDGQELLFEMIASTRRGTYRDKNGKRLRLPDRTKKEQMQEWLQNRFGASATINRLELIKHSPIKVIRKNASSMVWPCARLVGLVTIKESKQAASIIANGMGQGAAFGLGAMILPEVMKV